MKIKTFLSVFLVVGFIFQGLSSQVDYQETFKKANEFYTQGDFKKAYEFYQKIPNKGPGVNYNLGNCAYKLGQFGYALLYWRRAEKDWGLLNGREELLDNIALLKSQLNFRTNSKVFSFFEKIKNYSISLFRSAPLLIIQILFLILWMFLFLYLRRLYRNRKKFLISILFFLIALLGTLLVYRYRLDFRNCGVVINKKTALLSGPGEKFQELGMLTEASEFIIQNTSDDYFKVKVRKQIGWINKKEVEKI